MRFTTKAAEFEVLKAEALEKLETYVEALKNASYEEMQQLSKSVSLAKTYSEAVERNAAFRTFLYKDKIQSFLKEDMS